MEKTKSFKVNVIFNTIYQILALLTPLITTPYISRIFNSDLIGRYSFLYSIVTYFTLVAAFGFNDFGTKIISENRDNYGARSKIFSNIYISKMILSIVVLIIYGFTFFTFLGDPLSLTLLLTMALYIVTIAIDPIFYFQGTENFVSICIRNIIVRVLTLVLIFIFVRTSDDLYVYSLILSAGNFLSVFIMLFSLRKKVSLAKPSLSEMKSLTIKSAPYFIPLLTNTLSMYGYQTLLGFFGNDTYSGLYAQTTKFTSILIGLISSISVIVLSRMSYLNKTKQEEEYNRKLGQISRLYWLISLPCFAGLLFINHDLVPWFFGDDYIDVVPLVYIMAGCVLFSSLNTLITNLYFRPNDRIKTHTIIVLVSTVIGVTLAVVLIYFFNAIGCAIATIFTDVLRTVLFVIYSKKEFNWKLFLKEIKIPILSTIVMSVGLGAFLFLNYYFFNLSTTFVIIIIVMIGVIFYGLALLIFKEPFTIGVVKGILRKLKR